MKDDVLGRSRRVLSLAVLMLVAACETPQESRTADLSVEQQAALARLPAEHRGTAERLLRDPPGASPSMPLVYVDGERVATSEPTGRYSVINPELIATSELLSPEKAVERIGPDGKQGVIWITTKAAVNAR